MLAPFRVSHASWFRRPDPAHLVLSCAALGKMSDTMPLENNNCGGEAYIGFVLRLDHDGPANRAANQRVRLPDVRW